jgi:hypothetical protein
MARVLSQRAMNKLISPLRPVQDAVEDKANEIGSKAEARLAAHRETGAHRIEIKKNLNEKYGYLDREVSLVGPAPQSVEFGHINHKDGQWVEGLYIIHGAVD